MRKTFPFLILLSAINDLALGQGVKTGEVIFISYPALKSNVTPDSFYTFITKEVTPLLSEVRPETTNHLFKADRGKHKGKFALVTSLADAKSRSASLAGNPFDVILTLRTGATGLLNYVENPKSYTEYRLIGAEKLKALPHSGILGIHYIQVKPDRAQEFEKLVVDKLHPAVAQLFPDMQLLYYKAVAGDNVGSYITIFTIDSPTSRDKYWPAGAPETKVLKERFKPLEGLAKELGTYLVDGSYLKPESGGAAAYWESREWTDFVHSNYLK